MSECRIFIITAPQQRRSLLVAIYTLRGNCGSVRVAARIVGGRVYSKDQSYQASAIPAQEFGDRREENAPALGQRRDAQDMTESGGHSCRTSRSMPPIS